MKKVVNPGIRQYSIWVNVNRLYIYPLWSAHTLAWSLDSVKWLWFPSVVIEIVWRWQVQWYPQLELSVNHCKSVIPSSLKPIVLTPVNIKVEDQSKPDPRSKPLIGVPMRAPVDPIAKETPMRTLVRCKCEPMFKVTKWYCFTRLLPDYVHKVWHRQQEGQELLQDSQYKDSLW